MPVRFVNDCGKKFKVAMKDDNNKTVAILLWGDHVRPEPPSANAFTESQGWVQVNCRGQTGWVPKDCVGDEGLLEFYVIDVGQGDGVLMRTPDDEWHVIDAGVSNAQQMTRKGAANFIRWKFQDDLGRTKVTLKYVIVSHPDFDHYGGMIDLLSGDLNDGRTFPIEVENFIHCGMGRFKASPKLGSEVQGDVDPLPHDDYGVREDGKFIVELLSGKSSFKNPSRAFDGSFAALAKLVGDVPASVRRVSHRDEYLPGYEADNGSTEIRILGPILERVDGQHDGLRVLGDESKTRNGHSIVLRVDYGDARFLLTGDLNTASQRLLLSYHLPSEFAVDVAKGCHHGSDDIDLQFVKAMSARATIVSSGDNEDYAHPRPRVLGASARYGRESKNIKNETLPPLLYSTELARSVRLAPVASARTKATPVKRFGPDELQVKADESKAKYVDFENTPISTDLVYGLINVRSDGKRILCAYMEEAGDDFDIQVFRAGIDPS